MMNHLNDRDVVSYIHQSLTDVQREDIDRHLATCPACRTILADHEALQQHIRHSLTADLRTFRASPRTSFAAIAPRLKRHGRLDLLSEQSRQLFSSVATLAIFAAFVVVLVALFESISHSGTGSPAPLPTSSLASAACLPVMSALATVTPSPRATPQHTVPAQFGQGIRLMGYDLSVSSSESGAVVTVTLHWQAQCWLAGDYIVLVSLIDTSGRVIARQDGTPVRGDRPTTGWMPGEYITDIHSLALPADFVPGEYRLAVGLYDPKTGVRLDAQGQGWISDLRKEKQP